MYSYLDRPVDALNSRDRLLLISMRLWVRAASTGRCPCSAAGPTFRGGDLEPVLPDFNMAMAALNTDALGSLRFAPPCGGVVRDDEARLLTLFAAGADGSQDVVLRLADQLVLPHAARTLTTAVLRVSAMITAFRPGMAAPRSTEA